MSGPGRGRQQGGRESEAASVSAAQRPAGGARGQPGGGLWHYSRLVNRQTTVIIRDRQFIKKPHYPVKREQTVSSFGPHISELAVRLRILTPARKSANVSRVTPIIPRHHHHHEISVSRDSGHHEGRALSFHRWEGTVVEQSPSFCCRPHSSGRPGAVEERAVMAGTQLHSQSSDRTGGRAREVACRGEEVPERVHGETAECLLGCAARPGVTRAACSVLLPSSDRLVGPDASSCVQTGPPRRDGGPRARATSERPDGRRPVT